MTGFETALTRVMNQYARELGILKDKDENFDGKDIRNGLVAIISIKHPDPQFEGQTKTKLGNTDAKTAVDDVFSTEVQRYFDKNVEILRTILENSMKSYNARKAGDKARTAVLKQLNDVDTKSKLAACTSNVSRKNARSISLREILRAVLLRQPVTARHRLYFHCVVKF